MKKLLTCLVIFFSSVVSYAQKDLEKETITILPESELIISGSTNVNKFDCKFNIDLITDPKEIKFTKSENFIHFSHLNLELLTQGFDCGNKRMNSDFQDLLLSEEFPKIVIELNKIEALAGEYVKAYVSVQLAGKSCSYTLPVLVESERYKGKLKLNIRDFGLVPPKKALGLIEVDEMIEVQFDLKVSHH